MYYPKQRFRIVNDTLKIVDAVEKEAEVRDDRNASGSLVGTSAEI